MIEIKPLTEAAVLIGIATPGQDLKQTEEHLE